MKHSALVSLSGLRPDAVTARFSAILTRHLNQLKFKYLLSSKSGLDFANLRLFIKLTFIYIKSTLPEKRYHE